MLKHILIVSLLFLLTANYALSQSVKEWSQIEKDADLVYQLKKLDEKYQKEFKETNVNRKGKIDFSSSDDFLKVSPTNTWDLTENPNPEINFPIFNNGLPAGDINGDDRNDIIVTANARDERTPQMDDNVTKTAVFFSGTMSDIPDQLFYNRLIPVGDLNYDGYSDAIAQVEGVGFEVYQGSPTGYKSSGILVEVPDPNSISYNFHGFADFDGDGYGDVVIYAFNNQNSIYVLWGGEDESSAELHSYELDQSYPGLRIASGRISQDNYDELVLSKNEWNQGNYSTLLSHFAFSDREIENKQNIEFNFESVSQTRAPMLHDLDGNGRSEIILTWYNSFEQRIIVDVLKYDDESTRIDTDAIELYDDIIYAIGDLNNNGRVDFYKTTEDGKPGILFTPQNLSDGLSVDLTLNNVVEDGFYWSISNNLFGDLNGDGVDDFVIRLLSDSEIIRGFVSGSESEILETEYVHFERDAFLSRAAGIKNVGDINGDGSDDIVILDIDQKRLKVFFNIDDLTSPSHIIDLEFIPRSVSSGDVNGSGINDLVIGYSAGNRVDLVFGGQNLSSTPDHKIDPEDFMTATLSRVYEPVVLGDINNSGYDDIGFSSLFSYSGDPSNSEYVGEVYIILGDENISNTPDITLSNGKDFHTPSNSYIGWSLKGLGDVSGNGISDFAFTNLLDDKGKVLIYYGRENSSFTSPDVILEPETYEDNISNFGMDITAADFTGNGISDLVVLSGFANERLLRVYEGGDGIDQQADYFTGIHESTGMGQTNINSDFPELISYVSPMRGGVKPVRDVNLPDRYGLIISSLSYGYTNAAYFSSHDLKRNNSHTPTFVFEAPNQNVELGLNNNFAVQHDSDNNSYSVIFHQERDNNNAYLSSTFSKYSIPMALSLSGIEDIPNDQGHWVTVKTDGWLFEGQDYGHQKFANWAVWLEGDDGWESRSTVNYMEGAAKKVDIRFPTTLPTNEDPTESSPHTYNLKLTAHDGDGTLVAESNQVLGHALDNIAPEKITGLSGEVLQDKIVLSWNSSGEYDLENYLVWELDENGMKNEKPLLETPETEIEFELSEVTESNDLAVSAIDIHGNEGEMSGVLSVDLITSSKKDSDMPSEFDLAQNYPNPFNPTTTIRYALPESTPVQLSVYTITGQEVARVVNRQKSAGWHTAKFDASNLSTGVYMYRLQAGDFVQTQKMMLIK